MLVMKVAIIMRVMYWSYPPRKGFIVYVISREEGEDHATQEEDILLTHKANGKIF